MNKDMYFDVITNQQKRYRYDAVALFQYLHAAAAQPVECFERKPLNIVELRRLDRIVARVNTETWKSHGPITRLLRGSKLERELATARRATQTEMVAYLEDMVGSVRRRVVRTTQQLQVATDEMTTVIMLSLQQVLFDYDVAIQQFIAFDRSSALAFLLREMKDEIRRLSVENDNPTPFVRQVELAGTEAAYDMVNEMGVPLPVPIPESVRHRSIILSVMQVFAAQLRQNSGT